MDEQLKQSALDFHEFPVPGKIQVSPTKPLATQRDLALAYSPGVAFACEEIARDPKLAIYDEPEAGIDLWSFDRLTETFRDIHEARDGRSIVIISHQERIISLADEIVLLRDGRVAETGTPAELMPRLGFAARSLDDHGCPLSTPTELHLTEIPTTC